VSVSYEFGVVKSIATTASRRVVREEEVANENGYEHKHVKPRTISLSKSASFLKIV